MDVEMRAGAPGVSSSPNNPPVGSAMEEEDPSIRQRGDQSISEQNAKLIKFGGAGALVVALIVVIAVVSGGGSSDTGDTGDKTGDGGDADAAPPPSKLGAQLMKEFCETAEPVAFPGLDELMLQFRDQLEDVCQETVSGEFADIVQLEGPEQLNASAFSAFLLKPQGALSYGAEFQSLTDSELKMYQESFEGSPPEPRSYITPLLLTFTAFGQQWGVLPASPVGDTEYKIRGAPYSQWKLDFPGSSAGGAGLAIAQEEWEKLAIRLAEDITRLKQVFAVSYSMKTTVFFDASPENLEKNTLHGKHAWRVHNWDSDSSIALLLAGIEEYLHEGTGEEGQMSEGVYGCRFVLFILTQMLSPCRWPESADSPEEANCIMDFVPVLEKMMGEGDLPNANDQNYLEQVCEKLDDQETVIMSVVAGMLMHVVDHLDSDKPCVNGFRAPEHCKPTFRYDGKEYTGCVGEPFEDFTDIRAPWCSWEPELQRGTGWDGPWSYCSKCEAPAPPAPPAGEEPSPTPAGEEPAPAPTPAGAGGEPGGATPERAMVESYCEDGVEGAFPDVQGTVSKILDALKEACDSDSEKIVATALPSSRGDNLRWSLKLPASAGGGGIIVYALNEGEQAFWQTNFAQLPPDPSSYLVPLVGKFSAHDREWGVTPDPRLPEESVDSFVVKGFGNEKVMEMFADGGLVMGQEHWEKFTIRLSEDVRLLKEKQSAEYAMSVSLFEEEPPMDFTQQQTAMEKRMWRAYDAREGEMVGVLLGGIEDYLTDARGPHNTDGVTAGIYECHFFLLLTTQLLRPCKWPRMSPDPPKDADCVTDFYPVFQELLPDSAELPSRDAPDFLDQVCKLLDEESTIFGREGKIMQYVDKELNGGRPCGEDGMRAPEHCIESFKYKGEEYSGCADAEFEYEAIKAPFCSWVPELKEGSGWDGPWSYCTKCEEASKVAFI